MGLQAVRVWTKRGWLVLASDASDSTRTWSRSGHCPLSTISGHVGSYKTVGRLAVQNITPAVPGTRAEPEHTDGPRAIRLLTRCRELTGALPVSPDCVIPA
jgi:hypothetical protein